MPICLGKANGLVRTSLRDPLFFSAHGEKRELHHQEQEQMNLLPALVDEGGQTRKARPGPADRRGDEWGFSKAQLRPMTWIMSRDGVHLFHLCCIGTQLDSSSACVRYGRCRGTEPKRRRWRMKRGGGVNRNERSTGRESATIEVAELISLSRVWGRAAPVKVIRAARRRTFRRP